MPTTLPPQSFASLRIEAEHDGQVAHVVLVGPGKRNTMGPDFFREMPLAFDRLSADPTVRVVVVRGSDGHFSAGLDLMAAASTLGPLAGGPGLARQRLDLLAFIEAYQEAMNCVARCRKPVLAAIAGGCIGGAVDLISACDIRLASKDAVFSVREVKIGIVADIGSLQRLPHIIGEGHTRELALTGRNIDATRAHAIGLVSDVYETEDAMLARARDLAAEIAANPPLTVLGIKQVMNDRVEPQIRAALRNVALWNAAFLPSTDLTEAITAFAMRRPPVFKGE